MIPDLDGKVMTPYPHWQMCSLSKQLVLSNEIYKIYGGKKPSAILKIMMF